ncbi:unnamed protein product [Adineta ricciae]|uniref:HTH CENPB-type domain-containing protein n=1 Tax=Adineta ricciae TaxID=249248 RepID=A0A815CBN7_ADIRI|nr:unnamed protein product [Adineta ricciae]
MKDEVGVAINNAVYEWFVAQRSKKIPIFGPILQEYAKKVALEMDRASSFKASNGWLERFRARHNIQFRVISGEGASISPITVDDWKARLPKILEGYHPANIYNCDETGLFFKLKPDRSLVLDTNDCKGGKKAKDRYTILLCANWAGMDKMKPVVIGKAAKPRCFKNMDITKLPVTWCYNRTAWMNVYIFTKWLEDVDMTLQKEKRKILLFLDNAPVHPPDIQLKNITLKFFPANTTAQIQLLDQGVIRAFKAHYRRHLIQHIIANAATAYSADDVIITALDAICWIESAWKSVTESTIRNTFRKAGFEIPSDSSCSSCSLVSPPENIIVEKESLAELDKVLKHLTIGGHAMSADDFVNFDQDVPVFNQWEDDSEKVLSIDERSHEDSQFDEDIIYEQQPSLSEALEIVRRLHLLSIKQHPELHQFVTQLQSKLIDVYLQSDTSKQRSILDFFKAV